MECNKFKNKSIEVKIKIVKEQRLCWNCFSKVHVLKDCKSSHRCKVSGCNQQHHTLLHREKTPEASANKLATSEVNRTTYLQLLPTIVSHGTNSVSAVAFLDSESDSTPKVNLHRFSRQVTVLREGTKFSFVECNVHVKEN